MMALVLSIGHCGIFDPFQRVANPFDRKEPKKHLQGRHRRRARVTAVKKKMTEIRRGAADLSDQGGRVKTQKVRLRRSLSTLSR